MPFSAVESSFMVLDAGDERSQLIREVGARRGSAPSLAPPEWPGEAATQQEVAPPFCFLLSAYCFRLVVALR